MRVHTEYLAPPKIGPTSSIFHRQRSTGEGEVDDDNDDNTWLRKDIQIEVQSDFIFYLFCLNLFFTYVTPTTHKHSVS